MDNLLRREETKENHFKFLKKKNYKNLKLDTFQHHDGWTLWHSHILMFCSYCKRMGEEIFGWMDGWLNSRTNIH